MGAVGGASAHHHRRLEGAVPSHWYNKALHRPEIRLFAPHLRLGMDVPDTLTAVAAVPGGPVEVVDMLQVNHRPTVSACNLAVQEVQLQVEEAGMQAPLGSAANLHNPVVVLDSPGLPDEH